MYVVGGNEQHGKVNYLHSFNWCPEEANLSNYQDPSTLRSDLSKILDFGFESKPFCKFEIIIKNSTGTKLGSLFMPEAFVKFRCPKLYKLSEKSGLATDPDR